MELNYAKILMVFGLVASSYVILRNLKITQDLADEQESMKMNLNLVSDLLKIQENRIQRLERTVFNIQKKAIAKLDRQKRQVGSTMPESCEDLVAAGHTSNGFYLVKTSNEIHTIFCDFSQPSTDMETAIGTVDVKTSPVLFYVLGTAAFSQAGSPIPFQVEKLNLGGGMNMSSGIFTAPKPGIYHFTFSALKNNANNAVNVYMYCNKVLVGSAFGAVTADVFTLSLSSTLHLEVGDQIKLIHGSGVLYGQAAAYTHFTGSLLKEDLVL